MEIEEEQISSTLNKVLDEEDEQQDILSSNGSQQKSVESNNNKNDKQQSEKSENKKNSQELKDNNEQICIVRKKQKQQLKVVDYNIKYIPQQNILQNKEFFYCKGDIVIDFTKKDSDFDDRYSAWNICKLWPKTEIQKNNHFFSANLQSRYDPIETHVNQQVQKYKLYPDLMIHTFFTDLEKFLNYQKQLHQILQIYFFAIKQSQMLQRQYYYNKALFNKYMESVYKKLNEDGAIFFASHSGPDIENCEFNFYQIIFSESLSQVLGKSLEELQDMYRRNGAYEFYDFNSQMEVFKIMVSEQMKIFDQYSVGNFNITKEKIPFKNQFRMATYDDIVFYTNVNFQMFKFSEFTGQQNQAIDFYSGILYFEITPVTIQQIISIRSSKLYQNNTSIAPENIPFSSYNLEYTIQSEIFKEKFIDNNYISSKLDPNSNKMCKFRYI